MGHCGRVVHYAVNTFLRRVDNSVAKQQQLSLNSFLINLGDWMVDTRDNNLMLEIKELRVGFRSVVGATRAVNGLSLDVRRGEIVGLVGESGCGKSVTGRSVLGLVPTPPGVYESGEIWVRTHEGTIDVFPLLRNKRQMRRIRGRDVSMIFQEPMRSLHPMMTIGSQITEGILEHEAIDKKEAVKRTVDMLELVALPDADGLLNRYPHELSGGMRQRVMIALALACRPQLLIADEPTTALDVTIQAQILDLLTDLRESLGMSVLLITHNMGVVANTSDRVAVMYLGRIVEMGTVEEVFERPSHPYTQGLLASMPSLFGEPKTHLRSLKGVVPELAQVPQGCVFADRCSCAMIQCAEHPPTISVSTEHKVACWLYAIPEMHAGAAVPMRRPVNQYIISEKSAGTSAAIQHELRTDLKVVVQPLTLESSVLNSAREVQNTQVAVENLVLHYPISRGILGRRVGAVRAVDGLDLSIHVGETLGLVGESGCGKTSVGRLITRLVDPTAGTVFFRVNDRLKDITQLSQKEMKAIRRRMGMVFQDPLSSLNPRMNIRDVVGEPLMLHRIAKGRAVNERVGELLQMVGLRPEHQNRFPHAFSGGQRQRIAIARALATDPRFIVADESVSSLDVSVQSQILNLLLELQQQLHLSMLFIAHDIAVVRHVSDRMAVMYLGKIVELGPAKEICSDPAHPYTEALLASILLPIPRPRPVRGIVRGELPDPTNPPSGCRYHTRCAYSKDICRAKEPSLVLVEGCPNRLAACHFSSQLCLSGVGDLKMPTNKAESAV